MYENIKSEFIRNKIKETSWEAREYIDDLIKIEDFILRGGPHNWSGAMYYHQLKTNYRREWEIIYEELNPKKYAELIKHEEEEKERERGEDEKRMQEEEKELERKRKEWMEMGGKI